MDATRVSKPHTAVRRLSDRRHHELLVKFSFSRIIVWSERELTTQDAWDAPIPDPVRLHHGRPGDVGTTETPHA